MFFLGLVVQVECTLKPMNIEKCPNEFFFKFSFLQLKWRQSNKKVLSIHTARWLTAQMMRIVHLWNSIQWCWTLVFVCFRTKNRLFNQDWNRKREREEKRKKNYELKEKRASVDVLRLFWPFCYVWSLCLAFISQFISLLVSLYIWRRNQKAEKNGIKHRHWSLKITTDGVSQF